MSSWADRVRTLLRSTDEVRLVLEAVWIPKVTPDTRAPNPHDSQNKRILAVISHKDDWDLTEEGCVFVCKTKSNELEQDDSSELEVHRILPVYGSFSIVMSQMRRNTIDLQAGMQKTATQQPRSGFSLAITPAEGVSDGSQALFYTQNVQELRDFIAECRRLKDETTIDHDGPINVAQSTTYFSWLRPYILKQLSPLILASVPPDLRLANQPLITRLTAASAGQPGDDYADLQLMRDDWVRAAARNQCRRSKTSLKLRVGTFNVNGKMPSQDLSGWIQGVRSTSLPPIKAFSPLSLSNPFEKDFECAPISQDDNPDMLVLGFQELDLSTEALIYATNTAREDAWCGAVFAALGEKAVDYEKLASKQLVGMLIVVIVKKAIRDCFSSVQAISAGAGILGVMGNKGGTAIRLSFTPPQVSAATVLTFVNAHLAAFDEMVDKRNQDFNDLSKRLNFQRDSPLPEDGLYDGGSTSSSVYESDALFWLGDLNYRIDVPDAELRRILRDEEWENEEKFVSLLRYDQLHKAATHKRAFVGFQENPITHLPTYRFSPGLGMDTLGYDLKRKPAWTDRVLYIPSPSCHVSQTSYSGHPQITLSDHRPVSADFVVEVDVMDQERYTDTVQKLYHEVDHLEGSGERKGLRLNEDTVDFGTLRYEKRVTKSINVKNQSKGPCGFRLVSIQTDSPIHPAWLSIHPQTGVLLPEESLDITFVAHVDKSIAMSLNQKPSDLDGTIILHTLLGKDHFISISAQYEPTCFGNSLAFLTQLPGPIRKLKSTKQLVDERHRKNAPSEIIRLINWLMTNSANSENVFLLPADDAIVDKICECLDTGDDFPYPASESPGAADPPQVALAFGATLLRLLDSLPEPVIPGMLHPRCVEMSNRDEAFELLDAIQPAAVNVWISLTAFLHYLANSCPDENHAERIAAVFAPILLKDDPTSLTPPISPAAKRKFLLYFIS